MARRLIVFTPLFVSLAAFCAPIQAQENAPVESTLDPIVITGNAPVPTPAPVFLADAESRLDVPLVVTPTREVAPVTSSPYAVATLSDDDIVDRLGRSLPELLNETPSVMVQKTAHGQGSPFIRGFTGYRNLALIDGVRLNNSTFRDGPNQYWNTIDPYSLRSVELVKGQGSVLHGSDAIGGTLNALTARPVYGASGFLTGGRAFGRWSSAEQSYTGRVEGYASEADSYGFLFGFTGKDYGDLHTAGQGENPNSGYDEWERNQLDVERIPPGGTPGYVIGTVRGGYDLGNGLSLTAALENFTDEAYRVHGSGINGPERNFIFGAEWTF